jgi:hypothetical protein
LVAVQKKPTHGCGKGQELAVVTLYFKAPADVKKDPFVEIMLNNLSIFAYRLPERYQGQLKTPLSHDVEETDVDLANRKVINHNMNLQTALIINTLSKVRTE